MVIGEWRIGKNVKVSSRGLIQDNIQYFPGWSEENNEKPARIAGLQAEALVLAAA
jgi:hypothetical protein